MPIPKEEIDANSARLRQMSDELNTPSKAAMYNLLLLELILDELRIFNGKPT